MRTSGSAIPLLLSAWILAGCFNLPASFATRPSPCDGGLCAVPSDFGSPCQSAVDCLSSICLPDGSGSSLCSAECRTATDCPNGWACNSGACECGGTLCDDLCLDLTSDPSNCGACGRVCSADPRTTPFCTEGTCAETLITPQVSIVTDLVAGSGYICWTDGTDLSVIGETGGSFTSPASGGSGPIMDLSLEGSVLYWGSNQQFGSIDAVTIPSGGTNLALGSEQIGRTGLTFMVTDSANAYWIDDDDSVFKTPLTGGGVVTLATGSEQAIGLTVQGTQLYWALQSGKVMSVPIAGTSPPMLLAVGPPDAVRITSDPQNIYVVDGTSTTVVAIQILSGSVSTVVSSTVEVNDVTSDGTNLYWSEPAQGLLMKAPVSGGSPIVVASSQSSPIFLAVDGNFLYWANEGDGAQNGASDSTSINRIQK